MDKLCWSLLILVGVVFSACSTTREADNEVKDELTDFRSWMNTQSGQLADRTKEDWKQAKQDFQQRTSELDSKQDNFTDELKQEYQQLKQEFRDMDERHAKMVEANSQSAWEKNLLGRYADFDSILQENVRDAYVVFIENVRQQRGTWDNDDWKMAKKVMEKLNSRKDEVNDGLATEDEIKIKALQMEFRTLENAADVGIN
ncbi:hypothetical protein [Pontibacter harenae]|uniref:hypothetical protein n=1 Tax=Pontibacter harenae TaxID=2894083 RepID=UPI001E48D5EF|nr:hypothetical protein [Pontibacter harenae]MCC9167281.1 hypothetical protein [Pontibacter harenae]